MGHKDSAKILIDKNYKCVCASNDPFWKLARDVQNKVETRSMIKRNKK